MMGFNRKEPEMPAFICTACGMQYPPSSAPPPVCRVCQDERQFTPPGGQRWTTLDALGVDHLNAFRQHEPGLIGIGTRPQFAIGQRALLLCTPHGNVLWDCISLIDEATVTLIEALGGLKAIAISHPHFYTTLVEWSRAFGNVPVHLHADDAAWVMRPDPCVAHWQGETLELLPGVTLIRGGGHFPGGTMLHWAAQLSQCNPAVGERRAGDRRGAGAVPVRPGLQPFLRAGDPGRRQAHPAGVHRPLRRRHRRRLRSGVIPVIPSPRLRGKGITAPAARPAGACAPGRRARR
jgi:hypothetical protein